MTDDTVNNAQQRSQNTSLAAQSHAVSLTRWLDLTSQTTLPMLPTTGKTLLDLAENKNVSLSALTPAIGKDPVASLMIIRAANDIAQASTKPSQDTMQIITIKHCVGVIGFDRLIALIKSAPVIETALDQTSYVNYVGSLMRSLHAAYQARDWANLRSHHQPEHVFLSALLYGAPYWALWQAAPAEMKIIEHLKVNEKIPTVEAECAVLGVPASSLAAALAKTWQLPEDVQAAYDTNKAPNFKTLLKAGRDTRAGQLATLPPFDPQGRPTNTSATQTALANWLAQEADITWTSAQMLRCESVIAAFLNQPMASLQARLKQQALAVSRAYCLPGIQTPGGRLLQPRKVLPRRKIMPAQVAELVAKLMRSKEALAKDGPATAPAEQSIEKLVTQISKPKPKPKEQEQAQSPTSKNAAAAPQHDTSGLNNQKLLKKVILRFKQQPESFADATSVLQLAGHGLVAGLGLKRALILQLNDSGEKLCITNAFGQDIDDIKSLLIPLKPANLFSKLLQKPAALRVDEKTNSNVMTLVPANFKQATGNVGNFFTTSLFDGKRPIAIIYADEGSNGDLMREAQYQYFKALCKAAGYCLVNL